MDKNRTFLGTPLVRVLKNDGTDSAEAPSSSYKNRKARLDYQQTVRDSEGRQRFHGAFTGGFSAGYYNTVDTKEGFKPKEFVSHRSSKQQHGANRVFDNRPEDYMDEEDLGEFGIAPRKIRVNNIYSNQGTSKSSYNSILPVRPTNESIGDKILDCLSTKSRRKSCPETSEISLPPPIKNNFHGLGYKPLAKRSNISSSAASNPLFALLGEGKRLKISGEAFGSGVLEDEDDCNNSVNEIYGLDDMNDYEFGQAASSRRSKDMKTSASHRYDNDHDDIDALPGFQLAEDLNAMILSDVINRYPQPQIPNGWTPPTRREPYVPPTKDNPDKELYLQRLKTGATLGDKFTSAIKPTRSTDMDSKVGLLHYSDVKSTESVPNVGDDQRVAKQPTISRQVLEWRPCSLLCKRFNVPNPFPDNQFVGVKQSDLISETKHSNSADKVDHAASMELRRSIFNVAFSSPNIATDDLAKNDESSDSDDAPQIVILSESEAGRSTCSSPSETADVIVMPQKHKEPELIVLDSSSSASSVSSEPSSRKDPVQQVDDDQDVYGPPLPPSLKTLMNLDRKQSARKAKKKKKKHKKRSR